jgi:hypothetical protein
MSINSDNLDSDYIKGGTDDTPVGNVSDQLKVSDVPYDSGLYSELTVGTSAIELKVGGSMLTDRKYIIMRPKDNTIYFGFSNAVTTTSGIKMLKDEFLMLPIGVSVWLIADGAGKRISIGELS